MNNTWIQAKSYPSESVMTDLGGVFTGFCSYDVNGDLHYAAIMFAPYGMHVQWFKYRDPMPTSFDALAIRMYTELCLRVHVRAKTS